MTATADAVLIEQTLERLAEAAGDITPQVYEIFFSMHPETEELFGSRFNMACGHMLNDVLMTLIDQANGAAYANILIDGVVGDHNAKGVKDIGLYRDFLLALRATVETTLGGDWPQDERKAFNRHCDLMIDQIQRAAQTMNAARTASRNNDH